MSMIGEFAIYFLSNYHIFQEVRLTAAQVHRLLVGSEGTSQERPVVLLGANFAHLPRFSGNSRNSIWRSFSVSRQCKLVHKAQNPQLFSVQNDVFLT